MRTAIWGSFAHKNTPDGHTDPQKLVFLPYKQVIGRNGDHKWLRMINAFILCDLLWKVQKNHSANRERSLNNDLCHP